MRTGLLNALSTRYATFYFSDVIIVLDVLPYGMKELFSFLYPRTNGKKPVDDFCSLANLLGNAWWSEKQRTKKRYLASRHLLEIATNKDFLPGPITPFVIRKPAGMTKMLTLLKIDRDDLDSSELRKIIKTAFRRQAKIHHPDSGGDAAAFRKIQSAYERLIDWSINPTYTLRRGFPDRWFYDGGTNRWTQPTPELAALF